ncbi:MAG: metallophosphoesterase family protein [candidate division WOR-3 bacterium]|nr:MAG: metallophosphoesterase family protein [candidate division WOR-3 bacterium]
MKLGIFSDVHGNLEALEAVLGFLEKEGVGSYLCCGDIVGYGADPCPCIERVAQLRGPVVAGNHDWGAIGRVSPGEFNSAARTSLGWTIEQLSENEVSYLDSLALTEELDPFYMVHSSPSAPRQWEYVFMLRDAEAEMRYFSSNACLVGHSHYPFVVEKKGHSPARLLRNRRFEVRPDTKYLVNVGSVGQPRDGDPRACCATYDTKARVMSTYRLEYDVVRAQDKIRGAGLPEFLAERLAAGR